MDNRTGCDPKTPWRTGIPASAGVTADARCSVALGVGSGVSLQIGCGFHDGGIGNARGAGSGSGEGILGIGSGGNSAGYLASAGTRGPTGPAGAISGSIAGRRTGGGSGSKPPGKDGSAIATGLGGSGSRPPETIGSGFKAGFGGGGADFHDASAGETNAGGTGAGTSTTFGGVGDGAIAAVFQPGSSADTAVPSQPSAITDIVRTRFIPIPPHGAIAPIRYRHSTPATVKVSRNRTTLTIGKVCPNCRSGPIRVDGGRVSWHEGAELE